MFGQFHSKQQEAEKRPDEVRQEVKSEKLEDAKTEAKAAFLAQVSSLFGSEKLKVFKTGNQALLNEYTHTKAEILQAQIQQKQEEHQH